MNLWPRLFAWAPTSRHWSLFPGLITRGSGAAHAMRPGFERVVAAQPAARRSSAAQTLAMLAASFALVALLHTVSVCVPSGCAVKGRRAAV
jgi:hypothetical protein